MAKPADRLHGRRRAAADMLHEGRRDGALRLHEGPDDEPHADDPDDQVAERHLEDAAGGLLAALGSGELPPDEPVAYWKAAKARIV